MKKLLPLLLLLANTMFVFAQRTTDNLDRGLVAVKKAGGVFVSWRIFGEEYYDVTYNLYRDGVKLNEKPLEVSNYTDAGGKLTSKYTVSAVVRGVEQSQSAAVTPWNKQYHEIKMQPVYSRNGTDVTSSLNYIINDVSLADLDGDGVSEFILKRLNQKDADDLFPTANDSAYVWLEAYKMDGTRLWYIDCGPNMVSGGSVEINIVAYDWDGDGKAEVLLRGADGTIIHYNGGTKVVGNINVNTRNTVSHSANMTYTNTGAEFLIYMNGETGEPYQVMTYPLPRGNANDWGDGYGHRSSKYFFGAPFLNGRTPSIFLGRGIYTKHHFIAYDVDGATHSLKKRWEWKSDGLAGSWFGQGYHNYGIADVDWDGRDEIVYGSMVIDDNGKGLSTTGLGHGDAQHFSDLDPYRHGQEIFACNENAQGANYRDATTSKIYYFHDLGRDCGRAMAGNFYNTYPGSQCIAVGTGLISSVTNTAVESGWAGITQNYRIYWDGDLCEESLDGDATEGNACIYKGGNGAAIFKTSNTKLCNWTKNTPSGQGDILGDWREEIIIRDDQNKALRIYTTTDATKWRNYTLWHDHQYRQGMVWQMCGYNQPVHTSYFLGELEKITVAPPPLTNTGREEVANNGTISADLNDKHVLICETNNMSVSVAEGASPYILTVNTPTWVQGNNNNNGIRTTTYTHTLTGGTFTGAMRLVKQGDGILNLPEGTHTYTGETNVWAGTLNFDGTLESSPVWLNRFAKLNTKGVFKGGITMDYASELRPGGENSLGTVTVDSLSLGFGSTLVLDFYSEGFAADMIKADYIKIEKKNWQNGPEFNTPVINVVSHLSGTEKELPAGKYLIAEVKEIAGNIENITVKGLSGLKNYLLYEEGKLYLVIEGMRSASTIVWTGAVDNIWDFANTENFQSNNEKQIFVTGDKVVFDDNASLFAVDIKGELVADTVLVNSSKAYTLQGDGALSGGTTLVKEGKGTLTITNENTYTGGTRISGGTVKVTTLSNQYKETGNLGGMSSVATKFIIENGAVLQTSGNVEMGSPIRFASEEGGVINNSGDFLMDKAFSGTVLTKRGSGWLKTTQSGGSLNRMIITQGTVENGSGNAAKVVEFQGGDLRDNVGTNNEVHVPAGKSGSWTTGNRQTYTNKITGGGKLTVYCATEKGSNYYATRTPLRFNFAEFTGTLVPQATYAADGRFTLDTSAGMPNGAMDIPSGIIVQNTGKTFVIGKVTGKGSLGSGCTFSNNTTPGNNTWKVGNDENFKWEGTVTGNGTSFVKTGTGKLTLTAVHDFTGSMRVEQGQLHLNSGAQLGTGALTVNKGAILSGVTTTKAPFTNSSITINGTLQVGSSATSTLGTMFFNNKNVTFGTGSTYKVALRRCATASNNGGTSIEDINRLTMNGTVEVTLAESYEPVAGDSMRIWICKSFSGTPEFALPTLTKGLKWNTDRISEGLLFIEVDVTSIQSIDADEEVKVTVFSVSGSEIMQFTCPFGNVDETFKRSSHPSGIYLLQIKGKTANGVKKVVK